MTTRGWWRTMGVAVLGLAAPLAAHAQESTGTAGEVTTPGYHPGSGFGVEFLLGGGYSNFTGETARSVSAGAGTWDLRMVFGSRMPIGFEVAYIGTAQDLNATGLSSGAYLLGNGGEGSFRLALPIVRGPWMFAPFATAGLGWNYYSLQNSNTNTSVVVNHDSNFTVPLALGFDVVYQGFTFGARGTYRPTFSNNLIGDASLSTWAVSGNIGFEF